MKKINIYFTAGAPQLDDTGKIAKIIQDSGADMMEIGIPYSDPVADGPIIQDAHLLALKNGMTITKLFEQLLEIKNSVTIPKVLMGYINPVLQFGFEKFCRKCQEVGVSGLIIPDLPAFEFEKQYGKILEKYSINFSFLVTPETSEERIKYLDSLSSGFLYAVSSSSTTGNANATLKNVDYLSRLASLNLKNPVYVGFGIKNKQDFDSVTENLQGGIIGTAFVKVLLENKNWESEASNFVKSILS
ncbi:tryptophan synthase subunit alpha [Soonwooa sp.]|uniref:tryptophan synthase subunit alpha n=1 Tax=Soonwooa sp. TaxID=1938592 RepID=UPI0028B10B58|nr:tryptophan synthase subunit alpha [Soonwooa sp.]